MSIRIYSDYFTLAGCVAIVIYVVTAEVTALYASWRLGTMLEENKQVLLTWMAVVFVLLVIAYATKTSSIYSRRVLFSWIFVAPIALISFRVVFRSVMRILRKNSRNTRRAVIVGAGSQAF